MKQLSNLGQLTQTIHYVVASPFSPSSSDCWLGSLPRGCARWGKLHPREDVPSSKLKRALVKRELWSQAEEHAPFWDTGEAWACRSQVWGPQLCRQPRRHQTEFLQLLWTQIKVLVGKGRERQPPAQTSYLMIRTPKQGPDSGPQRGRDCSNFLNSYYNPNISL